MSVNKEIWLPAIEGNFYSEWEILNQLAKDDSLYVNNKTVHIPNAGSGSTLAKNNTSYPVAVEGRTDVDHTYSINSYQMAPVRIGKFETKDLSYDKTLSVVQDHTGRLGEYVKFDIFTSWYVGKVAGKYVETSGSTTSTSEAPASTATVKDLTINDVKNAAKILDTQKVPTQGRILLLPPSMFYQLHSSVIANYSINDNDGMMMFDKPLLGFKVVMQPEVVNVTSAGVLRAYGHAGATTDLQVGLAYQKDQVSLAKSDVFVYDSANATGYFGDTIEAEAWAGGFYRREDKKGVVPIIQKVNA